MLVRVVTERAATPSSLNSANALTALRLVAVPLFVMALFAEDGHNTFWRWIACGVFTSACLTDPLDGYVARRFRIVTDLGKLADPIADKALIGSALVSLSLLDDLSWWVTGLIIFREAAVTVLRMWALRDGEVIPASRGGKIKTLLQSISLGALIAPLPQQWHSVVMWGVWIAVIATVVTGLEYAWRILRKTPRRKQADSSRDAQGTHRR